MPEKSGISSPAFLEKIIRGMAPGGGQLRPVELRASGSAATEGIRIVDCDTHFTEPADTWTSRAPAGLRDRLPQLRRMGDLDLWFIGDRPVGPVGSSVIGKDDSKLLGKISFPNTDEMAPAAYDAAARVAFMDRLGIWAQISYPNSPALAGPTLMDVDDVEVRNAIVRIYNEAAAEWQAASGDRLFPQAVLPIWDRDALVAEAVRVVEEHGLTGITMPDRPEQWGLPDYLDEYWAPLFEVCDAHAVPLDFHLASGINGFEFVWSSYGFETTMAIGSMLFYITNAATLGNWLYSGLFDRYPNLKIVSVESGVGWIPFVLEALEYQFDEMMPNEARRLSKRPREYFADHVYACYWFEERGPRDLLDRIGVRNVLFETDFPHPTSLYPGITEKIERTLAHLDAADRRRVLQDNAVELYHLPVPA